MLYQNYFKYILLVFLPFCISCATSKTTSNFPALSSLPEITESYSVNQATSTMISFSAPPEESIAVYLYEPNGSPGFIIYQGSGGYRIISLPLAARESGYRLRSGQNLIVLVGPQGRAEHRINLQ